MYAEAAYRNVVGGPFARDRLFVIAVALDRTCADPALAECSHRGCALVSGHAGQVVLFQPPDVACSALASCRSGVICSGARGPMELAGNFPGRAARRHHHFQRTPSLGGLSFIRQHTGAGSSRGIAPEPNDLGRTLFPGRRRHLHLSCRASERNHCRHHLRDGDLRESLCALNILLDKWFDWMLSDAGASLLLTPLLLLWCARPSFLQVIRKQPGVFLISIATSGGGLPAFRYVRSPRR